MEGTSLPDAREPGAYGLASVGAGHPGMQEGSPGITEGESKTQKTRLIPLETLSSSYI